ncbi:MAG: protein-L-isoaspartate O-methyltransferase [Candidatus Yonathbacteria bacterium]|nr:protein-L-isoaspartate O-methyltransferase [Candidatus Yonathbacteria bacterium]NTW47839.1 protein-L-isoaspartate O-methyltransferase [Candidatus Yonathbacteria bacterium]
MQHLITQLKERGVLKTPHIIEAFEAIDRAHFVPADKKLEAYQNYPLTIGHGQTISQPETVAFMLELLQPDAEQTILDIGSGSGWQTALLSHIVGQYGNVYGMEIVKELAETAVQNINTYGYITEGRTMILAKSAEHGLPEHAPYDRIIGAATVTHIPEVWTAQLANGGRLVVPVGESIVLLVKHTDERYERHEYPGYLFVPFIS